ncbi:conjugal transfer protein TraH [Aquamicrobium sp.]|uniref:conjugal transfer protein TraH n=1 Tax=Aquamicrobium sp. TaxID=1872579 RepID=UPI00258A7012|nr:conjugal transfer protein TraH [Aquamicrobium sp.]MCK9549457.1 conjugal transfer protein TraH [Aquamicrobium sp.]
MNKINKHISIFVSLAILSSSMSYAANPFDFDANFLNTTQEKTWSDTSSGLTYHSGPNLEYRFQPASRSSVPWLQFQLPSASIGCNGLSIKGGFLALLGLDDIKLQLTDAGASSAWGVLTTIELTMPSIANVFHKIQQWARQLQALNQNACKIGQEFAKGTGMSAGINSFIKDSFMSKGAEEATKANEPDTWFDKVSKTIDDLFSSDPKEETKKTADKVIGDQIVNIGSSVTAFGSMFGNYIMGDSGKDCWTNNVKFIQTDLKNFYNGDVGTKCHITIGEDKKLAYTLVSVLYGDIITESNSLGQNVGRLFDANTGMYSKSGMEELLNRGAIHAVSPVNKIQYDMQAPVLSQESDAIKFLMKGSGNKVIKIPNHKLVFVKADISPSDTSVIGYDGNATTIKLSADNGENRVGLAIKGIYIVKADAGDDLEPIKWNGIYEESKKAIYGELYRRVNNKMPGKASNIFGGKTYDIKANVPVLLDNTNSYLNLLVQKAIADGNIASVSSYIDTLAYYNSIVYVDQLTTYAREIISSQMDGNNVASDAKGDNIYLAYLNRVDKIDSELKKEIRAMKNDMSTDIHQIDGIFKDLGQELKVKALKTVGNR